MHRRRKIHVEKKHKKLKKKHKKLNATRNGALTKAREQKISSTSVKYLIYITLKPKFCSTKIRSYQAQKYSKITPLPTIYMLPLKIVVTFYSIPNKLVFSVDLQYYYYC